MRRAKIVEGEYYHIYNRGLNKRAIFRDERDWARFLLYVIFYQSPLPLHNPGRHVTEFLKRGDFGFLANTVNEMVINLHIELVSFCLMPNHFHLIVREKKSGGIASYIMRIQDAYTRYFNTKHEKSGYLFQGHYQSVHVKDNRQLLYLSTYLHKNPKELRVWRNRWERYPWSSYQDFTKENRWNKFLACEIILEQFRSAEEYVRFVRESTAKELADELLIDE